MASICEQLQELATNGAVQVLDDCYLLSIPREIRDLIWRELFLRDYALRTTAPKEKPDCYLYGGSDESNPFEFKAQRFLTKTSDEIFDSELSLVLNVHGPLSTAIFPKPKEEGSRRRSIRGVEVLRTCKQICEEGLNVLYGMNTFYLSTYRHIEYIQHWRKWMQPTRVKGGSVMWSTDTLTALSSLFKPSQLPETLFLSPFHFFLQAISKQNAARITKIHFRVFLTPFGRRLRDSPKRHDVAGFIKKHNKIFDKTLSGLKELRMAGYWDDTLGKRAFARNHIWHRSSNYAINLQDPSDLLSQQVVCKITKNIETFVKRMPQKPRGHDNLDFLICAQPVLWSDIIELRKMNKRRAEIASLTLVDKACLTLQ